jgi:hypothetical protein
MPCVQHRECRRQRRGAPASTASNDAGHHPQRKPAWWMRREPAVPTEEEGGLAVLSTGRLTAAASIHAEHRMADGDLLGQN